MVVIQYKTVGSPESEIEKWETAVRLKPGRDLDRAGRHSDSELRAETCEIHPSLTTFAQLELVGKFLEYSCSIWLTRVCSFTALFLAQ